jgi:hypothetical protein
MIRKTAMRKPDPRPFAWLGSILVLAAALVASPVRAQELDAAELEELVAPVALYPDDVLGIVLPAATFPLDIVRAARFLDELEQDPALEPDESWDDSVVALLNYPEVLRMMNEDLDWTWALGEAVLTDQTAVLDAAQRFRSKALTAGNLRSDDKQIVGQSDGAIRIKPANPKVVYIPVYEPREVLVYHAAPIYHYYPIAYPLYYYPYPVGYSFGINFFWGVTSYFSIGWHSHFLHVFHHTHRRHPYYLSSYYYSPYYTRRNVNITITTHNYTDVWVPRPRRGARPRTVTVESRTSTVRPRTVTTESQPGVAASRTRPLSTRTAPAAGSSVSQSRGVTTRNGAVSPAPSGSASTNQGTVRRSTTQPGLSFPADRASRATPAAPETRPNSPARATRTTPPAPATRAPAPAPSASASPGAPASRGAVSSQGSGSTRRASSPPAAAVPRAPAAATSQRSSGSSTRRPSTREAPAGSRPRR